MGQRSHPHQQRPTESSLGSDFRIQQIKDLPLLPYERQLAQAIGATVEEYKQYRDSLINSRKPRPAAYDHVPEVNNEVVSIVTSLVIGLALTAVSALLAPKPKQQRQEEDKQPVQLNSQEGRRRFNNTAGFDGIQGVSDLGSTIPILFGQYQQIDGENYGGIYSSPALLWSRMFSYGSHQGFKGLYLVGEVTINTLNRGSGDNPIPLEGISIGTASLQSLSDQQYALYTSSIQPVGNAPTDGRIKAIDLIYGTRGYPAAGDPEVQDDIFTSPTVLDEHDTGFCMAYTPRNNSEFGVYGAVANGTAYRVNFKIVSYLRLPGKPDDPSGRINSERKKIAGEYGYTRGEGMSGVGRGYSPLMGINQLNGWQPDEVERDIQVQVGDVINFVIRSKQFTADDLEIKFDQVDNAAEDINNALNSRRAAADDALQVGELFMIGRTLWQVTERSGGEGGQKVWRAGDYPDINVTLKMIEQTGGPATSTIGIAGKAGIGMFGHPDSGSLGVTDEGGDNGNRSPRSGWCGPTFWPLTKVALAVIRNQRQADTTEIGLRSQVWNQATGLCNFSSLIKPNELREYDEDGIQVSSGTMSRYFTRTSVFTIQLREVDDDNQKEWQSIDEQFCVTGSTPVDQYNFIRIKLLNGPRKLEYRFVPKSGADVAKYSPDDAVFLRLNAKTGQAIGQTMTIDNIGPVRLTIVGDRVTAAEIAQNPEMSTDNLQGGVTEIRTDVVDSCSFSNWLPTNFTSGRSQAFLCAMFGDATSGTKTGTLIFYSNGNDNSGSSFVAEITVVGEEAPDSFIDKYDRRYAWNILSTRPVEGTSDGDWEGISKAGRMIRFNNLGAGTVFAEVNGFRDVGAELNVGLRTEYEVIENERIFEEKSQYADLSHYSEISRSNDSGPEHVIQYVNESISTPVPPTYPLSVVGLAVRSNRQITNLSQFNCWLPDGVNCRRLLDDSEGPSNLLTDLIWYLFNNDNGGIGSISSESWLLRPSFETTARFLLQNKFFFDGAIEQKTNLRNYLTGVAPFFLCNFVIAAGQFAITPALPFDEASGAIDPTSIDIAATFSEGNIIEGSYSLDYLDRSERERFKAVVNYRINPKNQSPVTGSVLVREINDDAVFYPSESFDLTAFCTSRDHAITVGKYLIAIRNEIDHTIKFKTLPTDLNLGPGQYIRVYSENMPTDPTRIAVADVNDGRILSVDEFADGSHTVNIYRTGASQVETIEIEVLGNRVVDKTLWGSVFSTFVPEGRSDVYLVEELGLDEDGLVDIVASHFPVVDGASVIAEQVLSDDYWFISDGIDV